MSPARIAGDTQTRWLGLYVLAYLVFLPLSARAYARRARLAETDDHTPPA